MSEPNRLSEFTVENKSPGDTYVFPQVHPWLRVIVLLLLLRLVVPPLANGAASFFSPWQVGDDQNQASAVTVVQPSQQVFLSWDPATKTESLTIQANFETKKKDCVLVIPTPTTPQVSNVPKGFFDHLDVYTTRTIDQYPTSRLLSLGQVQPGGGFGGGLGALPGQGLDQSVMLPGVTGVGGAGVLGVLAAVNEAMLTDDDRKLQVLGKGQVGRVSYKVVKSGDAKQIVQWLKNNYPVKLPLEVVQHYVKKQWAFTVVKVDGKGLKADIDGTFRGTIDPFRLTFRSEKLVYPLKMIAASAREKTQIVFYIHSPKKMDLPGSLSYQFSWIPELLTAESLSPNGGLMNPPGVGQLGLLGNPGIGLGGIGGNPGIGLGGIGGNPGGLAFGGGGIGGVGGFGGGGVAGMPGGVGGLGGQLGVGGFAGVGGFQGFAGNLGIAGLPVPLPKSCKKWLDDVDPYLPIFVRDVKKYNYSFNFGQLERNKAGITPTDLHWAKRLTRKDLQILRGEIPFSAKLPNPDEGFTLKDVTDPEVGSLVMMVIQRRLVKLIKKTPEGYPVRSRTVKEIQGLQHLEGHLKPKTFLMKMSKTFTMAEMDRDLVFEPAKLRTAVDASELTKELWSGGLR